MLRTAWDDSPLDDFAAEDLTGAARLALAGLGYVGPVVTTALRHVGDDAREATVTVVPGPRAEAKKVVFSGNSTFSSGRLAALLAEAGLGDRPWVVPGSVASAIEWYYAAAGFLNVRVSADAPRLEATTAVLPVTIAEGRQFTISAVTVTGVRVAPEADVRQAFGLVSGGVFTSGAAEAGAAAVRRLYGRRGHAAADVRHSTTFDRDRSTVTLGLAVDEGLRRDIAGVALTGDSMTSPRLTKRALTLPTSGPLDTEKVDDVQRRLYDLGVFRSVEPKFEPAGEPVVSADGSTSQPVRVVFELEEHARYRLRYGVQLSTDELVALDFTTRSTKPGATLDVRRNNLFGLGLDVGLGGFLTTDRTRVRAIAQADSWLGRRLETNVSATRDENRGSGTSTDDILVTIDQRDTNLQIEQRWRPTKRTEASYGYTLEYENLDIILESKVAEALVLSLESRRAAAVVTQTYDSRDNLLNPKRGMFHSASLEGGTSWLGSQLTYAKYLGQHFFYVPAGKRVTLASAARFGSVGILDEQEEQLESILVRFRTGGGTTVRGYEQDQLTPFIVGAVPRGGDVLLVLNQEVRAMVNRWLGGVAFVDAGNAFATWQDASLGGLKVGLGAGLRLVTPVGVIRLDAGFPTPRPADSPVVRWYFSFGQAF